MRLRTLPIFLAYLVMGVADAMGPMSHTRRTAIHISDVMAKLLPRFVYFALAIFTLSGGMLKVFTPEMATTGIAPSMTAWMALTGALCSADSTTTTNHCMGFCLAMHQPRSHLHGAKYPTSY